MCSPRPFNIRIFVADGQPDGLRFVEKSNWVGLGVVCPRTRYPEVKSREEFSKSAVYILIGLDDESEMPMVYVGEAETVRTRLNSHHADKDFWQQAIIFTTRGDPLNKAEVQYLEARLIDIAKGCGRCKLNNCNTPKHPGLSEPDQAQVEGYLVEMLSLLPLLGVHHFETQDQKNTLGKRIYTCRSGELKATGYESNSGFVVQKGSQAKGEINGSMVSGVALREHLINEKILVEAGEHYVFAKDYEFEKSTPASSIVQGRQAPGPVSWKDENNVTLKQNWAKESL